MADLGRLFDKGNMTGTKPERRHDIDWLRVLATLGVFVFHSMKMFDPQDWEVKNNATSESIFIVIGIFAQWMMPLFFLISGAAIFFSLSLRAPLHFIKSRVTRILIPFLIVGIFILIPPQEFIRLKTHAPEAQELTFTGFLPLYFTQNSLLETEFPFFGFPKMHLWYLVYLFMFSLVLLPAFIYLGSESGRRKISKFSEFFNSSWTIYFFALPIGILTSLLDPSTSLGDITPYGGWSFLVYPLFLIYGYIIFSNEKYQAAIKRQATPALVIALATYFPAFLLTVETLTGKGYMFGTTGFAAVMILRAFNSWSWLIAILGFGMKYFNYESSLLSYGSEGSLPFYMLHQTVIVVIGFSIAQWQMDILPKWIILITTSFIAIIAIYESLIRRHNISRFLFGLAPVKGKI